jgi:hypothetical protein
MPGCVDALSRRNWRKLPTKTRADNMHIKRDWNWISTEKVRLPLTKQNILVFRKVILRTITFYGNTENATDSVYFRCKYVYNLCKNIATALKFENCRSDVARSVFLCKQWNCLTVQLTYAGNTDAYPTRNTGPIPGSCSICPNQWSDAPITQGCPPCVQWIIIR